MAIAEHIIRLLMCFKPTAKETHCPSEEYIQALRNVAARDGLIKTLEAKRRKHLKDFERFKKLILI